jgi:N,N'-diacetyllegionaminate synthase
MFMSAPFDLESIDLLCELGLEVMKIPSGEITNLPYLRKIGALGKRIIMSTGMADLKEIEDALNILLQSGTDRADITILHCNTEYPSPFEDVNLSAMLTIKDAMSVDVGYSDHTLGIEVPIAAAALGAKVIEKHFTLDKGMAGPDHKASLEPDELKAMVQAIRNVEKISGDGVKKPSPSELGNRQIARKSIVARKNIRKGEAFSSDNITAKRPGSGISPMEWDNVIGKIAKRDFQEDEIVEV